LNTAVRQILLGNTRVPVTIRGVTMGNVGLESLTVNQVSL
jgi:hypothetical protein